MSRRGLYGIVVPLAYGVPLKSKKKKKSDLGHLVFMVPPCCPLDGAPGGSKRGAMAPMAHPLDPPLLVIAES